MTVLDTRRAGVSQAPNKPAPEGRGGLPGYTNQQQLNTGFVPRINTSAFAAPGRGLSAVGSAIGNLAGALDAHNKKNQDYEASLGFAKLQGELNRQEFAHRTTHEAPDGTGYATDWNIKANHVFGAFESSLTEEQRQKYAPALQRMKDGYSNKAATHQYGKTQKYQSEQLNNSYTIHQNLILKDPSDEQYENSLLALENQIDARDIPEPQKARDKATLRRQLDLTRALAYSGAGEFDKAKAVMEGLKEELKDSVKLKKPSVGAWKGKDIKGGIIEAASALGVSPVDLATAISYETAGTFNPVKRGPRTQWGRHKGLIQWGEPQAKQNGVDWKNPVKSQLGANGAIVKYLKNAGVKKGMGLLDIYSAINAGRVGRYNASDANNGGAPGTVRDKVQNQMRGHRKKAIKLLGGDANLKFTQDVPATPKKYKSTLDKIEGFIKQAEIKHQEEQFITGVVSGKIRITGNDTEAMKLMNKVFNEKFGPETDFLRDNEANEFILNLSKNKTVLPKRWFQKMEGYLSSAEPKDRELAFQLMDKVEANNPGNFNAGVGVQDLHKKLDQFRFLSEYHGPKGAVNQMMIAEERLAKMTTDELKTEKNQFIKDLNSEETLLDAFDDNIDFWPGSIFGAGPDQDPTLGVSKAQKAQIKAEFRHLAVSEFEKTGNKELAKASALHMIKKRYGVTEFSYITAGQRSVMKYPPESFVSSKDLPFVKEQFQKDSQEVVAKWSKILAKQGIKVIGEPILISDEHTRKGYEEWIAGKKSRENAGLLMSGLSMIKETRALPEWRFALKVEINGETGYRLVDDYFSIEGLAQQSRERLEHGILTNKAKEELIKEGKYRPNDPANFFRDIFGYEPRELVNKREEMLNRK